MQGAEKNSLRLTGARASLSIAAMSHAFALRIALAPVSGQGGFAFGWWRWTSSRWRG
jgi:hypothetical protein